MRLLRSWSTKPSLLGVHLAKLQPKSWHTADLEHRVSDVIGCRVTITTARKGGGEISIQFRDYFQLDKFISRATGEHEKVIVAAQH